MKSLVIYDSVFGNTEKLAQAVGKALGSTPTVSVVRVGEANASMLESLDLLIMASPTRGFRPTEGITKFLKNLPDSALQGVKVSAFDTRIDIETLKNRVFKFIVKRGGYANKAIAELLEKKGGQLIQPIEGFFVKDSEGPLVDGELERATAWAEAIKKI